MKRKILLYLGIARPTLRELQQNYQIKYDPIKQKPNPIGLGRHIEKVY